jgi:hypothetical protein
MESVMHSNEDGDQVWICDGQLHRSDGPAIICKNGYQTWLVDGKLHRLDGPAVIQANSAQEWWANHQRHRMDGPAIIWANGDQSWYINDEHITHEVNVWMRKQKITWPWDAETQAQFVLTFG